MTAASQIIQKCKKALAKQYGKRLKGVILYGSLARGEATPASDMDLLVLLDPPVDYFVELWNLYEVGSLSLYRNARREGVVV